jgi:hypothetical protein
VPSLSRIVVSAAVVTAMSPALASTPAAAASTVRPVSASTAVVAVRDFPFGLCAIWPKLCGRTPTPAGVVEAIPR